MRFLTMLFAVVAVMAQMMVPAWADAPFHRSNMLGWQKQSTGAAMAYFRLPLHETRSTSAQPSVGLMITGPAVQSASRQTLRVQGPRVLDFALTGTSLDRPWTASLNVGNTPAWASNPDALPRGTNKNLLESGVSWIAVGLISVGIVAGVLVMVEEDATPPTGGQ